MIWTAIKWFYIGLAVGRNFLCLDGVAIPCIVVLAFWCSVAAASAENAADTPHVWVLHDGDPDFSHPTVGDTLTGLFADGQFAVEIDGLNIAQTVGGSRGLTVSQRDHSVIVAEEVGGYFRKYDVHGVPVWSVDVGTSPLSVATTSDGTVYALSGGTIYGDVVTRISKDGQVLGQTPGGGFDVAIDNARQSMYVVGGSIKYLGFDLSERWSIDPIEWAAVSVDVAPDGSAWIAERVHPDVPGSLNRLLHVSQSGSILNVVDLLSDPLCVRVDGLDNSVYAAVGEMLIKFDDQGQELYSMPLDSWGWSIALDENRDVWVGTFSSVVKLSPDGAHQQTVMTFPRSSNTYVAVDIQSIPEPASSVLVAGLFVVVTRRRRRPEIVIHVPSMHPIQG